MRHQLLFYFLGSYKICCKNFLKYFDEFLIFLPWFCPTLFYKTEECLFQLVCSPQLMHVHAPIIKHPENIQYYLLVY